jgi:hypothetical protein
MLLSLTESGRRLKTIIIFVDNDKLPEECRVRKNEGIIQICICKKERCSWLEKIVRQIGAKGVNPDMAPGGLEISLIFMSWREIYSELLIIFSDRSWKNKE